MYNIPVITDRFSTSNSLCWLKMVTSPTVTDFVEAEVNDDVTAFPMNAEVAVLTVTVSVLDTNVVVFAYRMPFTYSCTPVVFE